MWGFTRLQQRAILFLLATFVAGCIILIYRRQQQPPLAAPALVAQFEKFARRPGHAPGESTASAPARMAPRRERITPKQVSINAATAAELTALPGIGAVMAQRIVEYRERHGDFRNLEELSKVQGIGRRKLEALKEWVVFE